MDALVDAVTQGGSTALFLGVIATLIYIVKFLLQARFPSLRNGNNNGRTTPLPIRELAIKLEQMAHWQERSVELQGEMRDLLRDQRADHAIMMVKLEAMDRE